MGFKMETVTSVMASIREDDFIASLDLKDTYLQISIHPDSRRYLCFVLEGVVFQFKALCFGLSTAPQVFTRVFAPVSAWAHSVGIRLRRYLDDWLVMAASALEVHRALDRIIRLCRDLEIVVNLKKSDLEPKTRAKYMGLSIDSLELRAFPIDSRIDKFMELSSRFLAQPSPPARLWQSTFGHIII